ncbi:MAG TPA: hypothetical protein VI643_05920 [Planctomycetota bacterium]|nr:hypothetical protein [Planctomycetota bacterium]
MRKSIAAIFMLGATALAAHAQDKGGKVRWERDPQKAIEAARAAGKGMMLYFTSEG